MNRLKVFLSSKLMHFTWDLAYMDYSGHWSSDILNASYHVFRNPYKNKWFADPFILNMTDNEIRILVEEWYDPIQRGRISRLIVDRSSFELKSNKVVLDTGTHLSFPAIERVGQDIFIHPESSAIGKLESY